MAILIGVFSGCVLMGIFVLLGLATRGIEKCQTAAYLKLQAIHLGYINSILVF